MIYGPLRYRYSTSERRRTTIAISNYKRVYSGDDDIDKKIIFILLYGAYLLVQAKRLSYAGYHFAAYSIP